MSLQTAEGNQETIVYSPNKRQLLIEKEQSRTPVKIQKFSKTTDGEKLIINEMTTISCPRGDEYSFQFEEPQGPPLVLIDDITKFFTEYKEVSVKGKIYNLSDTYNPGKGYKLCTATLQDTSGKIKLDLWENYINRVQSRHVYMLTPVSLRSWQGVKKISTLKGKTAITEIQDEDLGNLDEVAENDPQEDDKVTKTVPEIDSIDKIESFLKCSKCFKKKLQPKANSAHCDFCGKYTRMSKCIKDVCAKIIIVNPDNDNEETITLTAFSKQLQTVLPKC